MIISQEYNLGQELSSKIINIDRDPERITQSALRRQQKNPSNSQSIQFLMFEQHTKKFLVTKSNQDQQFMQENEQNNKSTEELIGNRIDELVEHESICKRLMNKIKRFAQQQQFLQNSYNQYQEAERRYIEKTKIIYSHFLLKDIQLNLHQIQHLKSILYVPTFGEAIVKWGNNKYGHFLNRLTALQRLSHMQQILQKAPKPMQCRQQMKILIILILLLVVIRLS